MQFSDETTRSDVHAALSWGMYFVTMGFLMRTHVKGTEKGDAANPTEKFLAWKLCAAILWDVAACKLLTIRTNAQCVE
uniref:Uncharacterized protein n=1 Tax=Parascaris equorum TaxID=6256 RepID=A0A914S804_PAREQ